MSRIWERLEDPQRSVWRSRTPHKLRDAYTCILYIIIAIQLMNQIIYSKILYINSI